MGQVGLWTAQIACTVSRYCFSAVIKVRFIGAVANGSTTCQARMRISLRRSRWIEKAAKSLPLT